MNKNRITALFGIRYPIIQVGMVWCSGWRLASYIKKVIPAGQVVKEMIEGYHRTLKKLSDETF